MEVAAHEVGGWCATPTTEVRADLVAREKVACAHGFAKMASGLNAHGSCKGAALEIPIQVRVHLSYSKHLLRWATCWLPCDMHHLVKERTAYPKNNETFVGSWVCLKNGGTPKWVWVKSNPPGDRRFWSMFPFTRIPFWVHIFDPQPNGRFSFGFPLKPTQQG